MSEPELSALARALGRVPTGLYVVATTTAGGAPLGFVGSFVTQVGFAPPTVCVAVGRGRAPLAAMRASQRFAISILDGESSKAMGAFFRRYDGDETPFDHVAHAPASGDGPPIVTAALAWLDCRVTGEHETGDHVVVFGEVTAGEQVREGDPSVHLRKNGFGY
jgi:flavin reductase (DIM6/NTAB) family NADH-FMN oxidoreductase RutF